MKSIQSRKKIVLLAINLCFGFAGTFCRADDTSFGGEGANPMPIPRADVAMQDEVVIISGNQINKPNMKGEWQVSADFTFKNLTNQPVQFVMGFPFPVVSRDGNETAPAGMPLKVGSPLVHDFVVTVDGQPVTAKPAKIAANEAQGLYYTDAYLWPMSLAPNQTVKIHNGYVTGITFNVLGNNIVSYVIKTGGMWNNGTIGQAHFEVIPNTLTRMCTELKEPGDEYETTTPAGVQVVGTGTAKKYVWQLTKLVPKDDLHLCLQTGQDYVRYAIIYPLLSPQEGSTPLSAMTADQLRILQNTIYAQYGRSFADPQLQQYFNQQWWYQANPNYSDNMLTSDDNKALGLIIAAQAGQNKVGG